MSDNPEPNQPQTLQGIIDELVEIRDEKRELKKVEKELNARAEPLEEALMAMLDEQGVIFTGTDSHRVTLTASVVPNVEDWDKLQNWIKENDAMYLLERRISTSAWRELHESGEEVDGAKPFTKRGISLTKV